MQSQSQSHDNEEDDKTTNRALISVLDEFTQQQTTLSINEVAYQITISP